MKETFLAHYLISPVTGLYFDGTNFSAKRIADARLFTSLPNMTLAQSTWPGCELRSLTPTNKQVERILRDALKSARCERPTEVIITNRDDDTDVGDGELAIGFSRDGDTWYVEVLLREEMGGLMMTGIMMTFIFETRESAMSAFNVIARELGI